MFFGAMPSSILYDVYNDPETRKDNSLIQREEGRGPDPPPPPPLKNHKNIGFLSNTGPNPLKNHKTAKPGFNVRPSSKGILTF